MNRQKEKNNIGTDTDKEIIDESLGLQKSKNTKEMQPLSNKESGNIEIITEAYLNLVYKFIAKFQERGYLKGYNIKEIIEIFTKNTSIKAEYQKIFISLEKAEINTTEKIMLLETRKKLIEDEFNLANRTFKEILKNLEEYNKSTSLDNPSENIDEKNKFKTTLEEARKKVEGKSIELSQIQKTYTKALLLKEQQEAEYGKFIKETSGQLIETIKYLSNARKFLDFFTIQRKATSYKRKKQRKKVRENKQLTQKFA